MTCKFGYLVTIAKLGGVVNLSEFNAEDLKLALTALGKANCFKIHFKHTMPYGDEEVIVRVDIYGQDEFTLMLEKDVGIDICQSKTFLLEYIR